MKRKAITLVETLIYVLIIIIIFIVAFAVVNINKGAKDTRVQSEVRQIGADLETFKINSETGGAIIGKCSPQTSPTCVNLTKIWVPASGFPQTAVNIAQIANLIQDDQKNRTDSFYLTSDNTGWTVSALVPSLNNDANNIYQSTYCANSDGLLRECSSFPATDTNSRCPDSGISSGHAFVCHDII